MIHAKDARLNVSRSGDLLIDKWITRLHEAIERSSLQGDNSCVVTNIPTSVHRRCVEVLRGNGYEVTMTSYRKDGNCVIIRW